LRVLLLFFCSWMVARLFMFPRSSHPLYLSLSISFFVFCHFVVKHVNYSFVSIYDSHDCRPWYISAYSVLFFLPSSVCVWCSILAAFMVYSVFSYPLFCSSFLFSFHASSCKKRNFVGILRYVREREEPVRKRRNAYSVFFSFWDGVCTLFWEKEVGRTKRNKGNI
jgi:hypothetical protein